jgi:rod shape-determining protein MreD
MVVDIVKAGLLLTLAATAQIAIVNGFELVEGHADIVLLCLVGVGLLRGPIFGACAGFYAGLIVDVGTLGTLGLTSLLLTIAGYWIGRFGGATSNEQDQIPRLFIAVMLATVGVELGSLIVHLLLGESASVGTVVARVLLPSLALNLILAVPVYALCRRLFPPPERRIREVQVVQ